MHPRRNQIIIFQTQWVHAARLTTLPREFSVEVTPTPARKFFLEDILALPHRLPLGWPPPPLTAAHVGPKKGVNLSPKHPRRLPTRPTLLGPQMHVEPRFTAQLKKGAVARVC